jgi:hypothetical protein
MSNLSAERTALLPFLVHEKERQRAALQNVPFKDLVSPVCGDTSHLKPGYDNDAGRSTPACGDPSHRRPGIVLAFVREADVSQKNWLQFCRKSAGCVFEEKKVRELRKINGCIFAEKLNSLRVCRKTASRVFPEKHCDLQNNSRLRFRGKTAGCES